jgi:hypothetical protein
MDESRVRWTKSILIPMIEVNEYEPFHIASHKEIPHCAPDVILEKVATLEDRATIVFRHIHFAKTGTSRRPTQIPHCRVNRRDIRADQMRGHTTGAQAPQDSDKNGHITLGTQRR